VAEAASLEAERLKLRAVCTIVLNDRIIGTLGISGVTLAELCVMV